MCWIGAALLALALPAHAGLKAVAGGGISSGGSAQGCALNSIWFTQPAATLNCTDANFTWVTGTQTLGLGTSNFLVAEAANTLSMRNGVNAQSLFSYNTFTDASNYERGQMSWSGNTLLIGTDKAGTGSSRAVSFTMGGSVIATVSTSGTFLPGSNNSRDLGATATTWRNLYLGSAVSKVGGVVTSGNQGVPTVVATGRATAQAAAVPSLSSFLVGAADGSFEVSGNVLVTTATAHAFTMTVAYTDEGNTARTLTLQFSSLAGAFVTSIANAAGAVPYEGAVLHIRVKTATTITCATVGTFTTVVYNAECIIKQTN